MVLEYPIRLQEDVQGGSIRVTSPDVPEFTSWGKNIVDALHRSERTFLETLTKFYVNECRPIPVPSRRAELMEMTVKVKFEVDHSR